jgi:NitT/TauT family transport system ATP-binding protein
LPQDTSSNQPDFEASGISIREARVEYRVGEPILDGLSVEFAPGEIVALVGASGCGKSTLLRVIAKLLPLAAGEIEFDSGSLSRRNRDLAYVFQDATLLPWRTVYENVRLPLELAKTSREQRMAENSAHEARIAESLVSVGLSRDAWQKFPRELSGGMRMRTSIARALVTEPSILLLDEPFAALDDLLRSRLNDLILDLWVKRTRTVLFVTHNIAEAVYLSHRVAVFGTGRINRVLENRLPWPRETRQRTSLAFAEQFGAISSALAEVAQA